MSAIIKIRHASLKIGRASVRIMKISLVHVFISENAIEGGFSIFVRVHVIESKQTNLPKNQHKMA
jgi:hypothetical protein